MESVTTTQFPKNKTATSEIGHDEHRIASVEFAKQRH
jgi:hypothetical protein